MNLEKYQDPLKVRIAETIINHFKELAPNGEDISQSHLDNLVLSEFNRIQEDAQQQQQQLQGECYQNQCCTVPQCSKLKGVFSKPSGNLIVAPNFCFLSQRLQFLAACIFLNFA